MSKCKICGESYYGGSALEPREPCWCGQCAWTNPWEWDRYRGIIMWMRYGLARLLVHMSDHLTAKERSTPEASHEHDL